MQERAVNRDSWWYVDSGCSRHMTGERSLLTDFKGGLRQPVNFAGDKGGVITGKGKVSNGTLTLEDVNYVAQLTHNLVSVSQVADKGHPVHFTKTEALVLKPGFVIPDQWILMRAPRKKDIYAINMGVLVNLQWSRHVCYPRLLKLTRFYGIGGWDT